MISLGLDAAGMDAYYETVGGHHQVRTIVRVLDLDHQPVLDVSSRFLGGQLDLDTSRGTWTSAAVTLYDPRRETGLAGASVDAIGTAAKHLCRVFMGVRPPGGVWFDVPVITGAITRAEQVGDNVELEIQSKSVLISRAVHPARSWPKGTLARDCIRDLLIICGEVPRYMDLGDSPARLTQEEAIPAEYDGWDWVGAIGRLAGRNGYTSLYYDARGIARIRRLSTLPAHVFTDTDPAGRGLMLSPPTWAVDTLSADFATRMVVTGPAPSGGGPAPSGTAAAPASYPLSPDTYRWHGVPLAWTRHEQDDGATTAETAAASARTRLDEALRTDKLTVAVTGMPLPHLEPQDRVRVQYGGTATETLLGKMSLPLSGMGAATYGGTRLVDRSPLVKR